MTAPSTIAKNPQEPWHRGLHRDTGCDYAGINRSDRCPSHHGEVVALRPKPGNECLVDAALVGSWRASSLEYQNRVQILNPKRGYSASRLP